MAGPFWLTEAQMARPEPCFPKSHGKPRVGARHVPIGIVFINRNGLRWRHAPREYGRWWVALKTLREAARSPLLSSAITSFTPRRPRSARLRRNLVQTGKRGPWPQ